MGTYLRRYQVSHLVVEDWFLQPLQDLFRFDHLLQHRQQLLHRQFLHFFWLFYFSSFNSLIVLHLNQLYLVRLKEI